MKKSVIALTLLTMTIAMPAMAEVETLQSQNSLNTIELNGNVELNNVFDSANIENIQALELSKQEMKDTEGAWAPAAIMVARIGIAFFNPVTMRKAN